MNGCRSQLRHREVAERLRPAADPEPAGPEEHAVRFAQDVFLYLRDEEEKVKERLR